MEKGLSDNTLWYDVDSGCSCPSPFDNGDDGHDLKFIDKNDMRNFHNELENHYGIDKFQVVQLKNKVKKLLK